MDLELSVDPGQVKFDGLRTEEKTGGHVAVRQPFRHEERDLELLWGQSLGYGRVAPVDVLSRRSELDPHSLGPRLRSDPLECCKRRAKLHTRGAPFARSTQALAVAKLGAGTLEGTRVVIVQG